MAVQQIGLGCKSSKRSLSAKAAHFSHANTVYFSHSFYSFLDILLSHSRPLSCQYQGSVKHNFNANTSLKKL